jgi:hypothetical protein
MNCHLITPRAQRWLENACTDNGRCVRCRSGRSARILHLFDEVCNLVNEQGDMLSLVTPSVGPGPFTLVVDAGFTAVLDINQPVQVKDGQLTIGPLRLDTRRATLWQPRPFWSRLRQYGDCGTGDWRLVLSEAEVLEITCLTEMEVYLRQLLLGIQLADEQQIRIGAAALAGRGPGLTPLGDDVLLGVLYGLWVWQPRREWLELIVETAVPLTTTLSAAFLRAAAAGEAVWQWHGLVNGRAQAIDDILSIGHTSGAAAWTGFTQTKKIISQRITQIARMKTI